MNDTNAEDDFTQQVSAVPVPEPVQQQKHTILVIDDEEDILELFRVNLSKLGYAVKGAENADEAITLYHEAMQKNLPIAAVIVDLSLPGGMGGDEIKNKIKDIDPQAKIIVCSGNTVAPEMENFSDYGFDAALEKNFDRNNLKKVIESVLSV